MRLIDADALKERYENTTDCALVCIDEAPTIIVEEKDDHNEYYKLCPYCEGAYVSVNAKYCYNCGSELDWEWNKQKKSYTINELMAKIHNKYKLGERFTDYDNYVLQWLQELSKGEDNEEVHY